MQESFGNVRFRIRINPREGLHPGWVTNIRQAKRPIPGSSVTYRQMLGSNLATISLRLRFDSHDDYLAMQALLGRTSTLVLRSRFTNARGRTLFEDEETWEYLDGTTLDELGPPKYEVSGRIEALATFERAFDPATGRAS